MDFNLKSYRVFKVKEYLKKSEFFFFYHSPKLRSNEWVSIEQDLKKLKLKYYKIFNGTTLKTINNSIYQNLDQVICGIVLFIKLNYKSTTFDFNTLNKNLKPLFILLSLKLNNKIYSIPQLKGINSFSYKQNVFNLQKSLERYIKGSYKLTSNKSK
jgi:hypothetical protein